MSVSTSDAVRRNEWPATKDDVVYSRSKARAIFFYNPFKNGFDWNAFGEVIFANLVNRGKSCIGSQRVR